MTDKLRLIDLFAGTGAFSLAFGVNVVFANDITEDSKKAYESNFKHKFTLANINDIKTEDIPPHDILTAGFNCQPFSISGQQRGFNDERSNSFWKIIKILSYHKPKCVILENVKNILSHDNKRTFEIIKNELEKCGYHIKYKVLDTAKITGIPQHRERIYIVGFLDKSLTDALSLDFPNIEKKTIRQFLEVDIPLKYYYSPTSTIWPILEPAIKKSDVVYQCRRVYVRENKSNECPTLTANMGTGGNNVPIILDDKGIRKLTPRECFNLQGFPSSYMLPKLSDCRLYKLAGNAVSVPVVKLIADRVISIL